MSFDVFFLTCNQSQGTRKAKNPFTGEEGEVPIVSTPQEERGAIEQLFTEAKASPPDDSGCRMIQFADGGAGEFYFRELSGDEQFELYSASIRLLSPELIRLLYAVGTEGNMALVTPSGSHTTLVFSDKQAKTVGGRLPDIGIVKDVSDLSQHLEAGYNDAKLYRDQVLEQQVE